MKEYFFDVAVIGSGAAGMAAALEIKKNNFSVAIIEREENPGGILLQCIHNGFGLHEFKEELTGPEYAERFINLIHENQVKSFFNTTVMEISQTDNNYPNKNGKEIFCYSSLQGVFKIKSQAIILAMGCRERNRGNLGIPGTRPAGIMTAGLAQRLVNIDGYLPGKDIVIIGSGDIGLIMARRMTWCGCKVHAVIEIQEYPSGLTRNIVQCLNDYNIPLYLNHTVTRIMGKNRIEKLEVTPLEDGKYNFDKTFTLDCDTLLLSVGLIPENELSKEIGVKLNPQTNGPAVDANMMTNIPGVFACGNVLHVHDLVDYVTEEARKTGKKVVQFLKNNLIREQYKIKLGANIRYIVPQQYNFDNDNKFYLRSMIVKNNAQLIIKINNMPIKSIKLNHIQPSEMISFNLKKEDIKQYKKIDDPLLTLSIL